MMRRTAFAIATIFVFYSAASTAADRFPRPPVTSMPVAERRKIDVSCSPKGNAGNSCKEASNRAKNNFKAPLPTIPITIGHLGDLQAAIDADSDTFEPRDLPDDGYKCFSRDRLKNLISVPIGGVNQPLGLEGKRVILEAYVMSAYHANTKYVDDDGNDETTARAICTLTTSIVRLTSSSADHRGRFTRCTGSRSKTPVRGFRSTSGPRDSRDHRHLPCGRLRGAPDRADRLTRYRNL